MASGGGGGGNAGNIAGTPGSAFAPQNPLGSLFGGGLGGIQPLGSPAQMFPFLGSMPWVPQAGNFAQQPAPAPFGGESNLPAMQPPGLPTLFANPSVPQPPMQPQQPAQQNDKDAPYSYNPSTQMQPQWSPPGWPIQPGMPQPLNSNQQYLMARFGSLNPAAP